jgi:hypothetical protein
MHGIKHSLLLADAGLCVAPPASKCPHSAALETGMSFVQVHAAVGA